MNSRSRLIKAIDNSACLTRRQINDYIYKKLFPEEQYVVEMHLNECPFCNDAIEGFLKTSNANQLLSEVDTLQLPAVETQEEPLVGKVVPKKESLTPPVSKTAKDGTVHSSQRKTVTFEESGRKRGMTWKVGLAAAVVAGLGIWGLNRFNEHKAEKAAMLAEANKSAAAMEEGMSPPVSRQEDSAMNAKFGMQGQSAPVASNRSSSVRSSSTATDSDMAMADAADMPAAAAPTAAVMSKEAASSPATTVAKTAPIEHKSKTNAAPVMAKTTSADARAKSAEVVKEADMRTSNSSVSAKPVSTAVKTAATEKTVAKEKVRPSAKTPEERAKDAASKKAAAEGKAITQAEADYKKGMELYKKKQYAAALLYFQAVAKKPDMPNSKQAAKYVKLCKEQLAKDDK